MLCNFLIITKHKQVQATIPITLKADQFAEGKHRERIRTTASALAAAGQRQNVKYSDDTSNPRLSPSQSPSNIKTCTLYRRGRDRIKCYHRGRPWPPPTPPLTNSYSSQNMIGKLRGWFSRNSCADHQGDIRIICPEVIVARRPDESGRQLQLKRGRQNHSRIKLSFF